MATRDYEAEKALKEMFNDNRDYRYTKGLFTMSSLATEQLEAIIDYIDNPDDYDSPKERMDYVRGLVSDALHQHKTTEGRCWTHVMYKEWEGQMYNAWTDWLQEHYTKR